MLNPEDLSQTEKLEHLYRSFYQMRATVGKHIPANLSLVCLFYPILNAIPTFSNPTRTHLKNRLYTIINEAFLQQQLRTKEYLKLHRTTQRALQAMHLEVDKQLFIERIGQHLRQWMQNEPLVDEPEILRNRFSKLTHEELFFSTKIPEERLSAIIRVAKTYAEWSKFLTKTRSNTSSDIFQGLPEFDLLMQKVPKTVLHFWRKIDKKDTSFLKRLLNQISEHLTEEVIHCGLLERAVERRFFQLLIEFSESDEQKFDHHPLPLLVHHIFWMRLFLDERVTVIEFRQGEGGKNLILKKGMCAQLSTSIALQLLNCPDKPLKELKLDQICSDLRFNRALYHFEKNISRIPPAVLKKHRAKIGECPVSHDLAEGSGPEQLITWLFTDRTRFADLQSSDPALLVTTFHEEGRHRFYCRFDRQRRRYIFRDPNLLTAELADTPFEEGLDWLYRVFYTLLQFKYTKHRSIIIRSLEREEV